MTEERAHLLLENAYFKFAKTMKSIPHSYTLIDYWDDKEEFSELFHFVTDNGIDEQFFSKTYRYYYAGEYKYWSMLGYNQTPLINRAKI